MINPAGLDIAVFNMKSNIVNSIDYPDLNKKEVKDEALKKAAMDFESVFINKLLEIMNSTVQKSDFLNGGRAEETFKSMLNQQLAINISSSSTSSFGFAEQIYKQMKDRV